MQGFISMNLILLINKIKNSFNLLLMMDNNT